MKDQQHPYHCSGSSYKRPQRGVAEKSWDVRLGYRLMLYSRAEGSPSVMEEDRACGHKGMVASSPTPFPSEQTYLKTLVLKESANLSRVCAAHSIRIIAGEARV